MTPSTRDVQISRITILLGIADRLIVPATHHSVARQIQLAVRDLAEARLWLEERDVDQRPAILTVAEAATKLAACRLTLVQTALENHGPAACVID
jgi:hypothetical protein